MFPGNLSSVCCGSQRARKMVAVLRELWEEDRGHHFVAAAGEMCFCIGRRIQWNREGTPKGTRGSASLRGKTEKYRVYCWGMTNSYAIKAVSKVWVIHPVLRHWNESCMLGLLDGCIRWIQGGMTGALWWQCEQVQGEVRKCTKSLWRGC